MLGALDLDDPGQFQIFKEMRLRQKSILEKLYSDYTTERHQEFLIRYGKECAFREKESGDLEKYMEKIYAKDTAESRMAAMWEVEPIG